MIKSWDEGFINKMKWILNFQENTTTILINWKKYIFDKNKPLIENNKTMEEKISEAKENFKTIISWLELCKIFETIESKGNILNIEEGIYFSDIYILATIDNKIFVNSTSIENWFYLGVPTLIENKNIPLLFCNEVIKKY